MEIKFGSIQTQPKQKAVQAEKPTSTCIILHQNQIPFKGNKEAVCMSTQNIFSSQNKNKSPVFYNVLLFNILKAYIYSKHLKKKGTCKL